MRRAEACPDCKCQKTLFGLLERKVNEWVEFTCTLCVKTEIVLEGEYVTLNFCKAS